MNRPARFLCPILCGVLAFGITGNAWPGSSKKPPGLIPPNGVTCFDSRSKKPARSQSSKSPILVSPDGQYRAFTENKATAFTPPIPELFRLRDVDCVNTSRLLVAGPGKQPFLMRYMAEPTTDILGNSIQIVDWSPDSRFLLLMVWTWQYASDFGSEGIRILDVQSGASEAGMLSDAMRSPSGGTCSFDVKALGFSPEGNVVFRIWPTYEDLGNEPDFDSCVKKDGLRLFDIKKRVVTPLPDDYQVLHYGRRDARAAK